MKKKIKITNSCGGQGCRFTNLPYSIIRIKTVAVAVKKNLTLS